MEFDEHDDPDEEMEIPAAPPGYDSSSARAPPKAESEPSSAGARKSGGGGGAGFRYRECQKNHAVGIGGHAVDGCCEFMAAGEDGSLDALKCAACNCHRNFHRKEPLSPASSAANFHLFHHHHHHQPFPPSAAAPGPAAAAAAYYRSPPTPSGYLHVRPPLALPGRDHDAEDHVSNPSSSGGGGGGGGGSSSKKRFRTKFTQEQKEKMLEFAERVGWRIQKHDEAAVEQFCADTGVRRQVLKVWMHNNKHTLGKKP